MGGPAIDVLLEPELDGDLLYLPLAPSKAGRPQRALLGLRVDIHNLEPTSIRLTHIRVFFLGSPTPSGLFPRDVKIDPDEREVVYIEPEEAMELPGPPPTHCRVDLTFKEKGTTQLLRRIRAHTNPVHKGSYRFFGKVARFPSDNLYFAQKPRHEGNSQFFGHDISVYGYVGGAEIWSPKLRNRDAAKNESYFGWGVPIHAMADGIVIHARTNRNDNPGPGLRDVQRLGDITRNPVSALTVTRLSESARRVATVVRTQQGTLKVSVFDSSVEADDIQPRGGREAEAVETVAADALTTERLVTAARRPDGRLVVALWAISKDGMSVNRIAERLAGGADLIRVAKLSDTRFVTASRTAEGALQVRVWEVSDSESELEILSDAVMGRIDAVSVAVLGASQFVTAVREQDGALTVGAWSVSEDGKTLTATGSRRGEAVHSVACAKVRGGMAATCVRTGPGTMEVILWKISAAGAVTRFKEASDKRVSALAVAQLKDDVLAIATVRRGNLEVQAWKYDDADTPEDEADDTVVRFGEAIAGATDVVAVESLHDTYFTTAVRTADGSLKLINWYVASGGGNSLTILHGDELVRYSHFQKGSIPAAVAQPGTRVEEGQQIGKMGNSGRSSGVHTHIHAVAAPPDMTPKEMIAADIEGTLDAGAFRPLAFRDAQAMRLADVKRWEDGPNPFTTVNGHGLYFERMAIWPDDVGTPGQKDP
jgi:hypothetical protein